jgi:hypothetical protein
VLVASSVAKIISDSQPFLELDTGHDDISQPGSLRVPTIYGMQAVNPETLSESSHSKCTAVNPQVTNSVISLNERKDEPSKCPTPSQLPTKKTHTTSAEFLICRLKQGEWQNIPGPRAWGISVTS